MKERVTVKLDLMTSGAAARKMKCDLPTFKRRAYKAGLEPIKITGSHYGYYREADIDRLVARVSKEMVKGIWRPPEVEEPIRSRTTRQRQMATA